MNSLQIDGARGRVGEGILLTLNNHTLALWTADEQQRKQLKKLAAHMEIAAWPEQVWRPNNGKEILLFSGGWVFPGRWSAGIPLTVQGEDEEKIALLAELAETLGVLHRAGWRHGHIGRSILFLSEEGKLLIVGAEAGDSRPGEAADRAGFLNLAWEFEISERRVDLLLLKMQEGQLGFLSLSTSLCAKEARQEALLRWGRRNAEGFSCSDPLVGQPLSIIPPSPSPLPAPRPVPISPPIVLDEWEEPRMTPGIWLSLCAFFSLLMTTFVWLLWISNVRL